MISTCKQRLRGRRKDNNKSAISNLQTVSQTTTVVVAVGRRAHLGMSLVCGSCKQRFHSNAEILRHRASSLCEDVERYGCPHCSKDFGNRQILRLHMRVHEEVVSIPKLPPKPELPKKETPAETQTPKPLQTKPALGGNTKKIGFTKIRLEDCLRCDECSCVYMFESDYLKHMRNFHRQNSPRKNKQKKGCRSCCRHCNCKDGHKAPQSSVETERGNNNLFHFNIKDRWSKVVSRRLVDVVLKEEPADDPQDVDLSHLLSQVEVKIKTEPADPEQESWNIDLPVPIANIKTEPEFV